MLIYVVRTRTLTTWERLEQVLPTHLAYERDLVERGDLLIAGPLPQPDGGLAGDALHMFDVETAEIARDLADNDPFVRNGIREVIAVERWDARSIAPRLQRAFDA